MKSFLVISLFVALASAATTKAPVGARVDIDVNSDVVKEESAFAYQMISASLNSVHALKMGKVLKAQSQVVAGVMYYLTLEIEETDCMKTVTDMTNCKVVRTEKCEAQVLSRPWDDLHKKQLVSYACAAN